MVDAVRDAHLGLEGAVVDPFLHVLLMLGRVLGAHVRVENDEAAEGEPLGDDLHHVLDAVDFVRRQVVLGDHTAADLGARGRGGRC